MQVAFLDYARYLVGSMWPDCSPASFEAKRGDSNQGMHKRSVRHHAACVAKAARLAKALAAGELPAFP